MKNALVNNNVAIMIAYAFDVEYQEISGLVGSARGDETILPVLCNLLSRLSRNLFLYGNSKSYIRLRSVQRELRGRIRFNKDYEENKRSSKWDCSYVKSTHLNFKNVLIATVLQRCLGFDLNREDKSLIYDVIALFPVRELGKPINKKDVYDLLRREETHTYRKILKLCYFILEIEVFFDNGEIQASSVVVEDKLRPMLFEKFLFNFFKLEINRGKVFRRNLSWGYTSNDFSDMALLPTMKPDIVIEGSNKLVILDAKYYKSYLYDGYFDEKIRAAHLYQIDSYLNNYEVDKVKLGVLIYPHTSNFNLHKYRSSDGKTLIVTTLPIGLGWSTLRKSLQKIMDEIEIH